MDRRQSPGVERVADPRRREQRRRASASKRSFDEFRQLFPAALCYTKIVPVDEVVTLDAVPSRGRAPARLMLDDAQSAQLDRLWDELHFVSQDALTLVDAFEQLLEYATQDADPKVFEPMRKPIHERAAAFRQRLVEREPKQLDALVEFAGAGVSAAADGRRSRASCGRCTHAARAGDSARRGDSADARARCSSSPAFLYRAREARPGAEPAAGLRLGAGQPAELFPVVVAARRRAARSWPRPASCTSRTCSPRRRGGCCATRKMRRLATEFACQWLHIHDFDELDEKSERHFPDVRRPARRDVRGVDPLLHRPVPATTARCSTSSTPTTRS